MVPPRLDRRRRLPSVTLLEAAAELVEPLALSAGGGGRIDARVVESYTVITAQHRQLYWTAPADTLLPSALSHTQLGVQLLSDGGGDVRRLLARSLAESALLGARLAFFDLRQLALAERCFEIATTAMREAGDHALAARCMRTGASYRVSRGRRGGSAVARRRHVTRSLRGGSAVALMAALRALRGERTDGCACAERAARPAGRRLTVHPRRRSRVARFLRPGPHGKLPRL